MKKNSLHFFNWYFLFSIFYYCFGRYKWNIPSYPKLIIFLITCYFFLNIGYRLTWKNKSTLMYGIRREYEFKLVPYKFIRTLFFISSLALIIFQVVWVIVFFDHFSIMNIFSMLGDNYYSRLDTTFDSKIPIMQFRTLLWGITLFSYPIGFLYFKIMPRKDKILFLITIMVDVFAALNMGISKNIGDIVIIFLGMMLLKNTVSTSRKSKRQNKKNIIKIITVIIGFLILFGYIQNIRGQVSTGKIFNPYGNFASYREKNIFNIIFGSNICGIIDKIGSYVSHAYTGLAYALELPFKNTYLLGFSRSLMEYIEQYVGISVSDLTYNFRIDKIYGWHNGQWWPTAFVWIGNAVSFVFVPLVIFLLGVFFRYLEDDFAKTGNIITATFYSQICITLVYLPCNMQIFQSRQSLFGTLTLLILFLLRRKLYKINSQQKGHK